MNLQPSKEFRSRLENLPLTNEPLKLKKVELIAGFGRTKALRPICDAIQRFLVNMEIDITPKDLYKHNKHGEVVLCAKKPKVQRKKDAKPVARTIGSLMGPNKTKPVCVESDKPLSVALSLMAMNDYSQLPIVEPGTNILCGYISWRTIGETFLSDRERSTVMDYGCSDFDFVSASESMELIEAARKI